ncbi:MAG: hypothetical protein WCS84_01500, partial [Nocardioides sp.]
MEAPRLLVPLDGAAAPYLRGLDQAVYAATNGYPSSSHLGVRLAEQDRSLLAHCRRATSKAFPRNQGTSDDRVPRMASYYGWAIKPIPFYAAPCCREVRMRLRTNSPLGDLVHVSPFTYGDTSPTPFRGLDASVAATLTGTGAAANSGTAIPAFRVAPGPNRIGAVFWSELQVTATTNQTVAYSSTYIQGLSGNFAFLMPAPGFTPAVIRLIDGTAAGSPALTGWFDVLGVRDSDTAAGVVNDVVEIWPQLDYDSTWRRAPAGVT